MWAPLDIRNTDLSLLLVADIKVLGFHKMLEHA